MTQPTTKRLVTEAALATYVTNNAPTPSSASTTAQGIVELATNTEATTGTDTARAVTPAGVKAVADTKQALQAVAATVTASGAAVVNKHNPVNATGGAKSLSLPTGQVEGTQVSVEKTDSSTNAVSITGSIRGVGSSTINLTYQSESLMLRADSSGSWWPIAGHRTKVSLDGAYAPLASAVVTAGKADGSDQSTTLQAAADALAALGGGELLLPSGTIVGHVSVDASVVVVGRGKTATILKRPDTWDGPVIQSTGYATKVANSGTGTTHDMGCRHLTIDGNRAVGGFTAPLSGAKPATPTTSTSTTGGTIAAGTQWYRIAPITAAGVGVASDPINQVTTGSTSTVTVNWSAITGATGYVIYGRGFNGTRIITVGAVTTWTDDGSLTPLAGVNLKRGANLTAWPALALYGWRPVVEDVLISNAPGAGMHVTWQSPTGAPASGLGMEAMLHDIEVENPGTNCLIWEGPHDSIVHNFIGARPGQAASVGPALADSVVVEGGGPVRFVTPHVWGQSRYGFALYGQADITTGQSEGALTAQILAASSDIHINGCEVFFPGGATAKGIVFGTSTQSVANVQVSHLHAYGFSSSSGTAVDLTNAGTGISLEGVIMQTTGTPITGSTPADAKVDLRVVGMSGGRFQVPGFSLSSGVDVQTLLKTSEVTTMTRRESNAGLSGFSSGLLVAGIAICQTAGTYTQARMFFTGIGSALTGAKIGVYDSAGTTKLTETANFATSITAANAWVTVALGSSVTLSVGDRVFLAFGETHTTTSVALRGLGVQASSFWPQTTAEGVLQYRGRNSGTWAGGTNALPTSVVVAEGPGVMPLIELVP